MRHYLSFLLGLFLIAALLRIDFFFTIAYLFFAIYLLARVWTNRIGRQVQVERRFVNRAFHGDILTAEVRVRNTGRLPIPWLHVHESLPLELISPPLHEQVFSLGPREQKSFTYTLYCRKRGYYSLGPLTAQTGDVLGLQTPLAFQLAPAPLIVYPRVIPLARVDLPTHSPLAARPARTPLFEDPSRVVGVREYQRGDSPRRIHWTATASAGQLLVKQYQPAIARETLLCLNLNGDDYDMRQRFDATELAITLAASLANHLIVREHLPVGLLTAARDAATASDAQFFLPPRPERAHLILLLETLARVQMAPTQPFVQLVQAARPRLAWGATLVLITGREDDALIHTCAYLRAAGFRPALMLVCAPARAQHGRGSESPQLHAEALNIPVRRLWTEKDLEQWR